MTFKSAEGWTLEILPASPSSTPGPLLEWALVREHHDASARAFWREGLGPWGLSDEELTDRVLCLRGLPTLDDVWTLYLVAATTDGRRHSSWESMVSYCADVRQGFWPDRIPPESAVQAIYRAIVQSCLLSEPRQEAVFLESAWLLCRRVAEALERGANPLTEAVLDADPNLVRYRELLRQDHATFLHDFSRARRFIARLPPSRGDRARARPTPLLVLDQPSAIQFKTWARTERSKNAVGYPLLLARLADGEVVLTVDPSIGMRIGWLAELLSEAEAARPDASGRQTTWYGGSNHGGTIVASPKEGTRLTLDAVLAVLQRHMTIRPERAIVLPARGLRALGVGLGGVVLAFGAYLGVSRQQAHRRSSLVLERYSGDDPPARYALIVGVCSYTGARELRSTCENAKRIREALLRDYGYQDGRVVLLTDDNPANRGAPCTAGSIRHAIEEMGSQIRREQAADIEGAQNSTFLFFYSGHGVRRTFAGATQSDDLFYGELAPAGAFEAVNSPRSESFLDVRQLREDIPKAIPSRQRMIILDACFSGTAIRHDDQHVQYGVASNQSNPTEFVLTAATESQTAIGEIEGPAWQHLSVFTYALLEGLRRSSGRAPADIDSPPDTIVTDDELAHYVSTRVPQLVNAANLADNPRQTPVSRRYSLRGGPPGQFVFVPQRSASVAARQRQ